MKPIVDREQLGRLVYRTLSQIARERGRTSGITWEKLPEVDRETDRRIGEAVADAVLEAAMGVRVPSDKEQRIEVQSGYGARTKQPFVTLSLPGPETRIQMGPAEALDLARNLTEGAEAALTDGLVVDFFHERMELGMTEVAALLTQLRAYRIRRSKEGT